MLEETLRTQVRRVSRSFAFVMEQLREPLRTEVQVGYLLFRLGDNVEDAEGLSPARKREILDGLLRAFQEGRPYAEVLRAADASRWDGLTQAERELNEHVDQVVEAFSRLSARARQGLLAQARIMFEGMARVQEETRVGAFLWLPDAGALDRYCYYVAGTVGDYLTERFLDRFDGDPNLRLDSRSRAQLLGGRRSLALVLQVTNILRDFVDDYSRRVIFYPRSFFDVPEAPETLLRPARRGEILQAGVRMARWLLPAVHLARAYVRAIPARARDVRVFCTIPYAMALRTLTLCVANEAILDPEPVKLSRVETRRIAVTAALLAPFPRVTDYWLKGLAMGLESKLASLGWSGHAHAA